MASYGNRMSMRVEPGAATGGRQVNPKRQSVFQSIKSNWRHSIAVGAADTKKEQEKKANCGFYRSSRRLPNIIEQTCLYLEQHALEQEGLFRVPGSAADIKLIKRQFDKGKKVALEKEQNVHTVAGVLKLFFQELPNPILTHELYSSFMCALKVKDEKLRLLCVRKVLQVLPPGNRLVLQRVTAMFKIVSSFAEANKMSTKNIALVMNASMFRDPDGSIREFMSSGGIRVRLLEALIDHHDDLFIIPKEELEQRSKGLVALSTMEVKLQLEEFYKTVRTETIALAQSLIEEGETDLNMEFEVNDDLQQELAFGSKNDAVAAFLSERAQSSNDIASGRRNRRRQGFRLGQIDMQAAFLQEQEQMEREEARKAGGAELDDLQKSSSEPIRPPTPDCVAPPPPAAEPAVAEVAAPVASDPAVAVEAAEAAEATEVAEVAEAAEAVEAAGAATKAEGRSSATSSPSVGRASPSTRRNPVRSKASRTKQKRNRSSTAPSSSRVSSGGRERRMRDSADREKGPSAKELAKTHGIDLDEMVQHLLDGNVDKVKDRLRTLDSSSRHRINRRLKRMLKELELAESKASADAAPS